ncbi:MAG: HAMP domain-containing sensor histidine kinase [Alkalispirochaeta sp.]
MKQRAKIESTEYSDLAGVVAWFIQLRWIAAIGVFAALLLSDFVYSYRLPYKALYSLTGILFLLNSSLALYFFQLKAKILSRGEMSFVFHFQIVSDYVILFLLIYLTGFLKNPLIYYFVFHVVLTAFIFPRKAVYAYVISLVVLFVLTAVAEWSGWIPTFGSIPGLPTVSESYPTSFLYMFALVSTILITGYLITSIMERVEERGQRTELELDHYRRLDQAKSNFILQVTHELRGPLAALKGYHEMILKGITGEISEKTQKSLQRANQRTQNLLNIIDEMLDYAYMKSEEDKQYEIEDLSLKEVLNHNFELYNILAKGKSIKLIISCPSSLVVKASRDLLDIILGNLITNAIKYSSPNTTVTVNAEEEKDEVHLSVRDEGMGIEPEELAKVFDEFHRTRRARKIEQDGTGLGLSIVQKAVNMLNGRVTVYSEVEKGTSFHIYLPGYQQTTENTEVAVPGQDTDE